MSRLTKVIATSRSVRFSVRRAGRESMYHPYAARRGDRRNWVATIGKTVLEPVRLLQSGIHRKPMFRGPKDLADVEGLFPAPRSKTPRSKPGRTFLQKAVYHTITYCQVKF